MKGGGKGRVGRRKYLTAMRFLSRAAEADFIFIVIFKIHIFLVFFLCYDLRQSCFYQEVNYMCQPESEGMCKHFYLLVLGVCVCVRPKNIV